MRIATNDFNDEVGAVSVPVAATDEWSNVTTAAAAMQIAGDDMLDGLTNTSGSEKRLGALEEYNIAAATFTQAIGDAKAAAMEPAEGDGE